MTINLMRRIDYWLGVPICFLLTLIDKILRLLYHEGKEGDLPKKILFIKPSEMGGIILSYPLLSRVQAEHKDAEIFFLTFESNKDILDILNIMPVENILVVRDRSLFMFVKDVINVILRLRRKKIDVVFDLEFFSRFTAILSYLSGASKRIGFYSYTLEGLYRGKLLTHNIQYNPHLHIGKMFLSFLEALDMEEKHTPELEHNYSDEDIVLPQFVPTEDQHHKVIDLLNNFGIQQGKRLFIINPGEGRIHLREWPLSSFNILVDKILEQANNYVAIVGTNECSSKAKKLCSKVGDKRCVDLSGKTSIPELLTLFSIADALITNDSGIAHLASLTKIKQFIFFGPESPRVFSPLTESIFVFYSDLLCSPCLSAYNHRKSACSNNICLKIINPEEAYIVISEKMSL